jgi:hypothetical protein
MAFDSPRTDPSARMRARSAPPKGGRASALSFFASDDEMMVNVCPVACAAMAALMAGGSPGRVTKVAIIRRFGILQFKRETKMFLLSNDYSSNV